MANPGRRTVVLSPDTEAAIERWLAVGDYRSDGDVIAAALQALDREYATRAVLLTELDRAVARGIADVDAGRVHELGDVRVTLRERYAASGGNR